MKKLFRYTIKGIAIFLGVLIVVYFLAYLYVVANKKEIISQIKDQVANKLNGEVQIGNISLGFLAQFPRVSVELDKVSIRDTLFSQHKHPFFEAAKVYASISVINLIKKENPLNGIQVDNGQMYLFTDSSGYTNSYLLLPKTAAVKGQSTSSGKAEIESIRLRNVRVTIDDQLRRKLYDFTVNNYRGKINNRDSILTIKNNANILIHSFAFNTIQGSFAHEAPLEGDFTVTFNKGRKQLSFQNIDLRIKKHKYEFSGAFNFADTRSFVLKISTKDVKYDEAKTLLTPVIQTSLSLVKIDKPVDEVVANISGPLSGGDPLVNITWKVDDNTVVSPFASFTDCSFDGSFTNELIVGLPRKDPNSRLQFHNFKGNFEGLTVKSQNIYIDNLKVPMINADIKTDFDLTQLNNLLGSSTIDLHKGAGSLNITYSGPLENHSNKNTLLNGKFSFSDGTIMYHPRNLPITNVTGNIVFKNTDVYVTDFKGNVQGSKIVMSGSGKNLLALVNTSPGKVLLNWNIYSPSLNLGNFTALLQKRNDAGSGNARKSKLGSTAKKLDEIVDEANFRLFVKTDELIYQKFKASNVKASIDLINENWILNNVSLQQAGGSMAISGSLTAKNSKYYASSIKANLENVDVNKVMYAFNDFGQSGISSDNLRGKLTSTVNVSMDIDRDLKQTPKDINGVVNFSLKNGALLHYQPLENIQKVAFKKRNFGEIYFAELKDRLDIKNKEIILNRMEIQSTVLTLYVEGVYSITGNNTDIGIQIPLSNLKKRDEDYKPENKGADSKGGASVFVRGRPGPDGNVQFKLDLFKKFRRKDKDKDNDKFVTDSSEVKF